MQSWLDRRTRRRPETDQAWSLQIDQSRSDGSAAEGHSGTDGVGLPPALTDKRHAPCGVGHGIAPSRREHELRKPCIPRPTASSPSQASRPIEPSAFIGLGSGGRHPTPLTEHGPTPHHRLGDHHPGAGIGARCRSFCHDGISRVCRSAGESINTRTTPARPRRSESRPTPKHQSQTDNPADVSRETAGPDHRSPPQKPPSNQECVSRHAHPFSCMEGSASGAIVAMMRSKSSMEANSTTMRPLR